MYRSLSALQSYILSTTTETYDKLKKERGGDRFNRTSFQQQLKPQIRGESLVRNSWLQSYILSTTTETEVVKFQKVALAASIVHPFNNN